MDGIIQQALGRIQQVAQKFVSNFNQPLPQQYQTSYAPGSAGNFINQNFGFTQGRYNPVAQVSAALNAPAPIAQQIRQNINNITPNFDVNSFRNMLPNFSTPTVGTPIYNVLNTFAKVQPAAASLINSPINSMIQSPFGLAKLPAARGQQQILADTAQFAQGPLTYAGFRYAPGASLKAGAEAPSLLQAGIQGFKQGAPWGLAGGALSGLQQGENMSKGQQLFEAGKQGVVGGILAGGAGGLLSVLSNLPKAISSKTTGMLQTKHGFNPQQARDEMGQFAKYEGKRVATGQPITPNEPIYYGDIRESLGLPRHGDYQLPQPGLSMKYTKDPLVKPLIAQNTMASHLQDIQDAVNSGQITPEVGQLMTESAQALKLKGITNPKDVLAEVQSQGQQVSQQALQKQSQIQPSGAVSSDLNIPQNLTKVEAKKVAANLGLQGKEPVIPTGKKPLGVVNTINESGQTTPALQMKGSYNPLGNKQVIAAAENRIATDPNGAYQFALNNHNAEANATAIQLAKQYEQAGQPQMAANLMIEKAKQALIAGQGNQVYSLWDKLSPETVAKTAQSTIERYNATARNKIPALTAGQYQDFVDQAKNIQGLTDPKAKDMATQALLKDIGRLIPSSVGDKAIALWRAGLLTGFRTPGKILVSHAISNTAEQLKQIPATGIDIASSLFTGKRSLTPTLQGNVTGFRQGISAGVDNFLHGYNAPNTGGMQKDFTNQVNFGNSLFGRVAQQYVDRISQLHGSLYKPFFGAAHLNSLYDQALTEAGNQGLKGDAINKFVSDFVAHPPEQAAQRALQEAEYTTFQNKTALGNIAAGFNRNTPGGIGRIVAPFTQIPSSIAMKLVDYSPVGAVKTIIQNIGKGNFDQRAFSMGLGRSITGTGLAAIGGALYAKGLMSLGYPTDKNQQALDKTTGKIPNAVKVNGKWRQLASLGPTGDVLAMGGNFVAGLQNGGLTQGVLQGITGGLKTISDSPYLQGIETITGGLQDPKGKAFGILKSYLGGLIPTGVTNIANAVDPLKRQTNIATDVITNNIPVVRQNNLPQYDALGQNVPRSEGAASYLTDPFYSSTDRSTPLTNELQRLIDSGNSVGLQALTANQTVYGQKMKLTPQQLTQAMQTLGPQVQQQLNTIISNPNYQTLDDKQKATILSNAISGVKNSDFKLNQILNNPPVINQNIPSTSSQPSTGIFQPSQMTGTGTSGISPLSSSQFPQQSLLGGGIYPNNQLSTITPTSGSSIPPLDKYQLQMAKDQLTNSNQTFLDLGNGAFLIKDPNTGSIKQMDLSKPITPPSLTGLTEVDRKAISGYNSDITNRINGIYALYTANQLTADQANTQIAQLKAQTLNMDKYGNVTKGLSGVRKGRKFKISRHKVRLVKAKQVKIKKTKVPALKFASPTKVKAQKSVKLKLQA